MIEEYVNNPGDQLVILLSPLDWGLGHATRCIPLIRTLQKYRATVILAAENPAADLLRKEFPGIRIVPLSGYQVRYSKGKNAFFGKIISQLPKIRSAIRHEKKFLEGLLERETIHGIISDNRLGLHSKAIPSVYITHQLYIETGLTWANKMAQRIHYHFINKYSACWVPDAADEVENLSGHLGHPLLLPKTPVTYLGPVSRFNRLQAGSPIDLLIILSGPEPQRTIFEELLLQQLKENKRPIVFIRGLPGQKDLPASLPNVLFHNHLPAQELGEMLNRSSLVLARSGYSTIMDLAATGNKAILVPTPGQGEQEYLANRLQQLGIFYCPAQENFNFQEAIAAASTFGFKPISPGNAAYEKVIYQWLVELRQQHRLQ